MFGNPAVRGRLFCEDVILAIRSELEGAIIRSLRFARMGRVKYGKEDATSLWKSFVRPMNEDAPLRGEVKSLIRWVKSAKYRHVRDSVER